MTNTEINRLVRVMRRSESRSTILAEILRCRETQDAEHGGPQHDDTHIQADWCAFIHRFMHRALLSGDDSEKFERNMIHIAALAVAAIESGRRKRRATQ